MARDITIEQLNGMPLPESVCGALTLAFPEMALVVLCAAARPETGTLPNF
jgi:hypothetical protein